MMFDDMAFIVNGPVADEPGWEQQQDCEEHQHFEEYLEELTTSISNHLMRIEWALREMRGLQATFAPENMSIGHTHMQGGQDHEL